MHLSPRRIAAILTLACTAFVFAAALPLRAQSSPRPKPRAAPDNELDAFMAKVLARREVNRKTLEDYVLDEVERFEVMAPGRMPLFRSKRDYTWYVRDGMHVRSPVRYNGVTIGEEERQKYEASWIRREKERQARKAKNEKEPKDASVGAEGLEISGTVVPTEPRFVSEAYFMDFKFEAGNYYLAGRDTIEGQEVLKVEYYPTRLFGDDDEHREKDRAAGSEAPSAGREDPKRRSRAEREAQKTADDIERRMNKTALVTLWIDPKEHQIVKYTFDNVWMDFLPGAWLVRVDDLRASMTMGQPFPGVWLPRGMNIHAGVTLANGSFEAGYERTFSRYRLAEVTTKVGPPKVSRQDRSPAFRPAAWSRPAGVFDDSSDLRLGYVAAVAAVGDQAAQEVIGEVRIHGNAFLSDEEVLKLAGVAVGQPLGPDGVDAVAKRLKDSGHFESVDVRKRYRSLTATNDIALVLVVHEKPGVHSVPLPGVPGVPGTISRPIGRLRSKLMFLPILSFADGYGFTYGGRMSTVDLIGINERLSVPLTWGGTRRAALEFERLFKTGPLTRTESSVAIWSRENPRFDIRDTRVEVKGRAERVFADTVRVGVDASRSTISFADLDDRLWTIGTSIALDTRLDPAFPGNAVLVSTGWTGMHFRTLPNRVNRYTSDARGYLRVFRQTVLAGRAQYTSTDASLPPYERLLLGGSGSVRGFSTGTFDGDRTLVMAAEVRAPITSVLSGAKLGVNAFIDAGKIWDFGTKMKAAEWHRGAGGGIFLIASVVRINLDVARGLKTGDTHVHLSSGFTF